MSELRRCYVCKRELPLDAFVTITVKDKRCKPGHSVTGPSYDCRGCRKEQRREQRRRKAEAAGRKFVPRGDRAAWEQGRREERAQRKADGLRRLEMHIATQKAEAGERRARLQESEQLQCNVCKGWKNRAEFQPSRITVPSSVVCRSCSSTIDAERFRTARETLSDAYVKRRIRHQTGIPARNIPAAMIEAKRIQLQIERALPSTAALYMQWIRDTLRSGPLDAEQLNQLARAAGFDPERFRRERRKAGAVYDDTTNTWRIAA